jgi:glutamate synthase domain-containing protein 3
MTIDTSDKVLVDAKGMHFSELGAAVREKVAAGAKHLELRNVHGQRYIGTGVSGKVRFDVYGVPGNDLAAFANGPEIHIHNNAQDACCNTMNDGLVVIHGRAGDIVGYSMRGGKVFVRDDVGYRVGIHMKENTMGNRATVVIGGTAQPFLGEYMAGGIILVLGLTLKPGEMHRSSFIGTGMHGGVIYLRGRVEPHQLGKEVGILEPDAEDLKTIEGLVTEYVGHFGGNVAEIMKEPFMKLWPVSKRPYGTLYAY